MELFEVKNLVFSVLADETSPTNTVIKTDIAASPIESITDLLAWATNIIIGIGWGLVFIMVAWGFVRYIVSRGEKTETQAAQQQLTYAVIGAIGLFMVGLIRSVILNALGAGDTGPGQQI